MYLYIEPDFPHPETTSVWMDVETFEILHDIVSHFDPLLYKEPNFSGTKQERKYFNEEDILNSGYIELEKRICQELDQEDNVKRSVEFILNFCPEEKREK